MGKHYSRRSSPAQLANLKLRWPAKSLFDRFWEKVDTSDILGCWLWKARKIATGYGQFQVSRGVWKYAHRLAYEIRYGHIDPALDVLHSCDNPPCVNPSHLRQGTHADNMADKVAKGRHRKVAV